MDNIALRALGLKPSSGNPTHISGTNTTDLAHKRLHAQVLF